ncbi:MAG TPA: pyridoxal phosphate-dependent aminotransferase [Clostridia bacterium]|nr:pyridoxal phosphate-dependent aminotransferase [Clostridia bacterium]
MFSKRTSWNLTPNGYSLAVDAARRSGRKLLDLTASNPTEVGLQYDRERLISALANPNALEYEPAPKGLLSARQAVAAYYREQGTELDPGQLVLTVSTSEAYSFCFRLLCEPGDEVMVPVPSYPLFEFLADLHDVKLVPYELVYDHGWQMDFNSLETHMSERTRAVLVVHPNNPTGSYVKSAELADLNAICSRREMAIIADEVFLDYGINGTPPYSFAANNGALTFTLSGLSKISGLPQMKVAWIATSGPAAVACEALERLEVIADTFLSMNAPVQWALPELLDSRRSIQQQLRGRVRTNLVELDSQLAKQKSCSRLQVEGGWYAILRVPITRSDEELSIGLLNHVSVLAHPGHFYDFAAEGHLVISLIAGVEDFAEGLRRILEFLGRSA